MEKVIPRGSALPQPGRSVNVLIGEPVAVHDLLEAARAQGWTDDMLYVAISDRIGATLHALKARLDDKPLSEVGLSDGLLHVCIICLPRIGLGHPAQARVALDSLHRLTS
jgi:hypothetical protein